jgi:hypothetical protein
LLAANSLGVEEIQEQGLVFGLRPLQSLIHLALPLNFLFHVMSPFFRVYVLLIHFGKAIKRRCRISAGKGRQQIFIMQ